MRSKINIVFFLWSYCILIGLQCPTIDSPPPPPLKAPRFIDLKVIATKNFQNEYVETLQLAWTCDSSPSLSTQEFLLMRQTSKETIPIVLNKHIPGTVKTYTDFSSTIIAPRSIEQLIRYQIMAIDSLDRYSDTSVTCTVFLARNVNLKSPLDTLFSPSFKWEVPQITDRTFSWLLLWMGDSLIWESDTTDLYTNGNPEIVQKLVPTQLLPLKSGAYYWGVQLSIVGGINWSSITIQKCYVP